MVQLRNLDVRSSTIKNNEMEVAEPSGKHNTSVENRARLLGKVARKTGLLQAAQQLSPEVKKRQFSFRTLFTKEALFATAAALVLVLTGYVSIDTWLVNRNVAQIAHASESKSDDTEGDEPDKKKHDSRPDETPLPANTLDTYQVPAKDPRAIYVDKIGLQARLMPMSVDSFGNVEAPMNIYDAGWYTDSVRPNETGALFIDAHSSGATKLGAFGKLSELENGDTITIETGSKNKFNYRVVHKETVPKDKVDMEKVLLPYGNSLQGLNLMTCAGDWTDDNTTMKDRVIVYTTRV